MLIYRQSIWLVDISNTPIQSAIMHYSTVSYRWDWVGWDGYLWALQNKKHCTLLTMMKMFLQTKTPHSEGALLLSILSPNFFDWICSEYMGKIRVSTILTIPIIKAWMPLRRIRYCVIFQNHNGLIFHNHNGCMLKILKQLDAHIFCFPTN